MPQNPRQLPPLEALWRGLSPDDLEIVQSALDYFDGTYNNLMDRLRELGATRDVYAAVNRTVMEIMGKPRSEVDIWNAQETTDWGDGYWRTTQVMDLYTGIDEQLAALATRRGFSDDPDSI